MTLLGVVFGIRDTGGVQIDDLTSMGAPVGMKLGPSARTTWRHCSAGTLSAHLALGRAGFVSPRARSGRPSNALRSLPSSMTAGAVAS